MVEDRTHGRVKFIIVLIGYGNNVNREKAPENVEWKVFHSDRNYFARKVLLAIYYFSEFQRQRISDFERCYPCSGFGKTERNQTSASVHKSHFHIEPLEQI